MSAAQRGAKRRWMASALGALIVVGLMLPLFRVPTRPAKPASAPVVKPAVTLSAARADELAMRDLAPLFLPTQHNAVPAELARREPGAAVFDRDAVKLRFSEANPEPRLPVPTRVPYNTYDAVVDPPGSLAFGIGRIDVPLVPERPHGGYVDIFAADAGNPVLAGTIALPPDARPSSAGREVPGWQPLEFTAAVDPAGLVGPLLLTRGSGAEDVDNHFRTYLAGVFRAGDRLPPGFYRIVVGP